MNNYNNDVGTLSNRILSRYIARELSASEVENIIGAKASSVVTYTTERPEQGD